MELAWSVRPLFMDAAEDSSISFGQETIISV
jgi:hypothetical protein